MPGLWRASAACVLAAVLASLLVDRGVVRLPLPHPAADSHVHAWRADAPWAQNAAPATDASLLNRLLQQHAVRLFEGQLHGVETVSVDSRTGRLLLPDKWGDVHEATPQPGGGYALRASPVAQLGPGRVLGNKLDAEGNLVMCDVLKGLMRLNTTSRRLEQLTARVSPPRGAPPGAPPGAPIFYANGLDLAPNGSIFFTSSTDILPARARDGSYDTGFAWALSYFRALPAGRVLVHHPAGPLRPRARTEVVASGFYYSDGVALAADGSYLLVVETDALRVVKLWLTGDKAGSREVVVHSLPGLPAGLSRASDGNYWLSMTVPVPPYSKRLRPVLLRTLIAWMPRSWRPPVKVWGAVLKITPEGRILQLLLDPTGARVATASAATEHRGRLFLGSIMGGPFISYVELATIQAHLDGAAPPENASDWQDVGGWSLHEQQERAPRPAIMASAADMDAWTALGGTVEERQQGKRTVKTWVAPDGKKLRSWKEAAAVIEGAEDKQGRKRGQASPDVAKDGNKDSGGKKRLKADDKAEPAAPPASAAKDAAKRDTAKKAAGAKKPAAGKPAAAPAPKRRKGAAKPAASDDSEAEEEAAADDDGAESMDEDAPASDDGEAAAGDAPARGAVGSGRQAAQAVKSYKDGGVGDRERPSDKVTATEEPGAAGEAEALKETQTARSGTTRRLVRFTVVDAAGEAQPLDRMDLLQGPLKITGAIYPDEGPLNKPDGRLLVEPFGPVTSWHVLYAKDGPTPVAVTGLGSYKLSKPAQPYRKFFASLTEQTTLAWHVVQAVDPDLGGSAAASLDAVVAKLARAKAGKGYATAREALLLNGAFVLAQLAAHEARRAGGASAKGKGAASFGSGPFVAELKAELAKGPVQVGLVSGNAITIRDVGAEGAAAQAKGGEEGDAVVRADEELARRLQAKMDAQTMAGNAKGRGRGGAAGGAQAYIKISEAEIADDYPPPQQYKAPEGVEETDELVLWDEEMADCDPEALPKRLLTDFSIYNAEGFFASLELLPMWSGVDPDVELFASGIVKDDEGDWGTGGQPLALAHGAAEAGAAKGKAAGGSSSAGGSAAAAAAGGSSSAGGSGSAAAAEAAAADEPAAGVGAAADVAVEAGPDPVAEGGMRLYLSQVREWVVEFSADCLFISIRTDAAWYKLCRPNPRYAPWYGVPLKAARVAVGVINSIANASRASKLSWGDVVKALTEAPRGSPTFISKRPESVERFLVVHGQILVNQLAAYPNPAVGRSAFASALRAKMEERKHSKLFYSKRGFSKAPRGVNRNPMKDRAGGGGRPKPMPATATTMVRSVWQNYFYAMEATEEEAARAAEADKENAAPAEGVAQEVEDDPLAEDAEEEADAQEDALAGKGKAAKAKAAAKAKGGDAKKAPAAKAKAAGPLKVTWVGSATEDAAGRSVYAAANVGSWKVEPGKVVLLEAEAEGEEEGADAAAPGHVFGLVQCLWEDDDGDQMAQVRLLVPGADTVLGDAAAEAELFLTEGYEDVLLPEIAGLAAASRLEREFDPDARGRQFVEDEALRKRNAAAKAAGKPLEYFYRHLYLPQQGMFAAAPADLGVGQYREAPPEPVALGLLPGGGFIKAGVEYKVGDFMYVAPDAFDPAPTEAGSDSEDDDAEEAEAEAKKEEAKSDLPAYVNKKSRFHKGSTAGLRAWGIGRLVEVKEAPAGSGARGKGKDAKAGVPSRIKLQRFYRPEDVSADAAYAAGYWDIYAPAEAAKAKAGASKGKGAKAAAAEAKAAAAAEAEAEAWLDLDVVMRKCAAKAPGAPRPEGVDGLDVFDVVGSFNAATKETGAAPAEFAAAAGASAAAEEEDDSLAMASMDIFAGCGGLSEGMHQAGVAVSRWAIEYEQPAADAFKLNNPDAAVFCNNCNVLLVAAMKKAGLDKDCTACEDARDLADKLSAEDVAALPLPGEVEFIMGGPPCQGYSGMNRFNKGNWSMVQNSMVMSYLSYADFYRPRYFLLENVRNFVSHNKSFTFRLTLRTLLEMGYQVRFGVLNAGNYGVPQSRKRTFIWAAAPDEALPDWPKPMHVFRTPQLTVNLPGGVQYCAVDTRTPGAPLRTVTVRDAIGDLPAIPNGHDQDSMAYDGPPVSAYQRSMRGKATALRDHISKEMNPLNLERCRCIPKETPGADWRVLLEIVKNDPSREKFNGQPLVPWCLPNTADRHNGWRGLFGRLDLAGHFPTSTTDPQPMGKVGQVFHPNQDRIVSVRECARSQGFPDHFYFSGNVHNRHRQVGNAVPPPLAAALGRQLRKALAATKQRRLESLC
ncbi:MET1B [Scenedesmus sp. PABB004]|nr:MET1B [Scenedesmus sp. PABB004]